MGNGTLDGADASLGQATVAAQLLFTESHAVAASVSGTVLFSGNRVFAFVDSGGVVTEVHEENNVAMVVDVNGDGVKDIVWVA